MKTEQVKAEIHKALEQVPDAVLNEILVFVQQMQSQTKEKSEMAIHLRHILDEDQRLLEKLAQ